LLINSKCIDGVNKVKQSQPLRIESKDFASFGTSRTVKSRLLFANNQRLEKRVLGYLAKYKKRHRMQLYSMVFSGSHYHLLNRFLECNRAAFYRDFNARIAEAVKALVPCFPGGKTFERRYSEQAIPRDKDIVERFWYCALQAVYAGLCRRISDYPGYNSFYDAIYGRTKTFEVVDWSKYRQVKRYRPEAKPQDFTIVYELNYERLPGFEYMSQKQYAHFMLAELAKRTKAIVVEWQKKGHVFMTKAQLKKVSASRTAKKPKISNRYSHRPLVLTSCAVTKQNFLQWYFSIYYRYKKAVQAYLAGNTNADFPPGTYRPPLYLTPASS